MSSWDDKERYIYIYICIYIYNSAESHTKSGSIGICVKTRCRSVSLDLNVIYCHLVHVQIPSHLEQSSYTLVVTGTGGLKFSHSRSVNVKSKSLSIFIQTDKAVYKPGQTGEISECKQIRNNSAIYFLDYILECDFYNYVLFIYLRNSISSKIALPMSSLPTLQTTEVLKFMPKIVLVGPI